MTDDWSLADWKIAKEEAVSWPFTAAEIAPLVALADGDIDGLRAALLQATRVIGGYHSPLVYAYRYLEGLRAVRGDAGA